MSYIVLARKWRPLTFDEMVGQEHIGRTLKNAVRRGRVAHAFLFTGSRGVGKTSAARILAKCMNCDHGPTPDPCNKCPSCDEITTSRSLDVYEIDGASNTSVDDIRELRENIKYMARPGKRKIYIIDEVHMLSKSAFNALLKTLEEPPEHVVFIFATTEPHKVPETIQSRCQRYDFKRIPRRKIQDRMREIALEEGLTISDQALTWIAKAADGSMRDGQSLLDQVISYCGQEIADEAVAEILGIAGHELFMRISGAVLSQDAATCIRALDEMYQSGYDLAQFYKDLVDHFRDLLMARLLPKAGDVLDLSDVHIEELTQQAHSASVEDLQRMVSILIEAEGDILRSSSPKVGIEVTLIRMARVSRLQPLAHLLGKIEALERRFSRPPDTPNSSPQGPSPSRDKKADRDGLDTVPAGPSSPGPVPGNAPSDHWGQFLEAVTREREPLGLMLENVISWELGQDTLKVFCPEGSFLYEKLKQREVTDFLSRIVKDYFGNEREFLPCPVKANEKPATSPDPLRAVPDNNQSDSEDTDQAADPVREETMIPAVSEALEVFGGTITEVKRVEREGSL